MTRTEIMTKAHRIARTLEGDYTARLSEGLKMAWEESKTVEFMLPRGRVKTRTASVNQFNYLESFDNVYIGCSKHQVISKMDIRDASKAIEAAKSGKQVKIS